MPSGTQINVRMIDSISSNNTDIGRKYRASLDQDLVVDGRVVGTGYSSRMTPRSDGRVGPDEVVAANAGTAEASATAKPIRMRKTRRCKRFA